MFATNRHDIFFCITIKIKANLPATKQRKIAEIKKRTCICTPIMGGCTQNTAARKLFQRDVAQLAAGSSGVVPLRWVLKYFFDKYYTRIKREH